MTDAPDLLLAHHLKTLKLPTLPRGNTTSSRASAPRRGRTMSASWPDWWNSN
ncbi:hypothetical protein SAMN05444006_1702 [Allgaiera indica]|uniref:Uncharacterized protein n=1 Tax=Allgaiera indica TaxID=765699 RepID=A0A1H3GBT5_9RHOB|nr:hypothetical protein SAMN05444006_1702 [Allgaiera indica]